MFGEILICYLIVVRITFGQPDPPPDPVPPPDQPLPNIAVGNDPLGDDPNYYAYMQFEETKWVQIPLNHPTCRLTADFNWPFEDHVDIQIQGQRALPRYYIKKRLKQAINMGNEFNVVQFVALQNPEAVIIRPNVFADQLMTIFCGQGKVELINTWRNRPGALEPWRREAQNCDIEERLYALCFHDHDVGSLIDYQAVFRERYATTVVNQNSLTNILGLVENCAKVSTVQVPAQNPRPVMEGIFTHLFRGANRANFNRVVVSGFGVDNNCAQGMISWAAYELNSWLNANNDIINNRALYQLYLRTTQHRDTRSWVFCLA